MHDVVGARGPVAGSCWAGLVPAALQSQGRFLFASHSSEMQAPHPITGHNNMTYKAFWIKKRESGLWREETPLFLQEAITFSDFSRGRLAEKLPITHFTETVSGRATAECKAHVEPVCTWSKPRLRSQWAFGGSFCLASECIWQTLSPQVEGLPFDKEGLPTVTCRLLASNSLLKERGVTGG